MKVTNNLIKFPIEEPLQNLITILRNNGFNTFCSCGHLPKPYIQMEWYSDNDITKLYNLLIENNYKKFIINGCWDSVVNSKYLEVSFSYIKLPLCQLTDIKKETQ